MDIGRYRVLGELGKGAMGVVYKAQDPAIGRTVAIKTIRLTDLTDPVERERMRDRLFREAQSAGILSHPNIVTIYDVLEQDGVAYVFMEYVEGAPLERLLSADEPPASGMILSVLRQTAGALDYAHRKGIVHRDIKPANIIVHDDGVAKVTDFGVAKIVSQQMTQAGAMMGTPSYMSPEQIEGTDVDGRADQWALAVIAYEVLTGEKPFSGEYLPTLLYKICRDQPTPPLQFNPTLQPAVETVLSRALSKSPAERYPTCCEFLDELSRSLDASPGWKPMARGMSLNMETVAVAPSERSSASEPALAPVLPGTRGVEPSHTGRNILFAVLAFVALGIGLFLFQHLSGPAGAGEETKQASTAPSTQPASPAPPPPSQEAKPSPVVPAQEEPQTETPAETPKPSNKPPRPGEHPTLPEPVLAQLSSIPPGATITIDNDPALSCTAPCSLALEPGRHVARATLDGYRLASRIFNTPETTRLDVSLDQMAGTLSVISKPPGATIILNGHTRPEKTPAALRLPPGAYRLSVKFDGVQADEDTVTIRDGVISERSYSLQ